MTVNWPGMVNCITPPHVHISFDILSIAGKFPINTVGVPGIQGETVFGTHGAGVNNTGGGLFVAGFATLLHIPKGRMLTIGLKSIIVAGGMFDVRIFVGITMRLDGDTPNEHCIIAPLQTHVPKSMTSITNSQL